MAEGGEKTEAATPRQRRRARERGQVAKSPELTSSLSLLALFLTLWLAAGRTGGILQNLMAECMGRADEYELDISSLYHYSIDWTLLIFNVLAPFFIVAIVVGLFSQLAQTGLVFSVEPIKPDISKINPGKGFQRMFSMKGAVELIKNILKLTVTGMVVYGILKNEFPYFTRFLGTDIVSSMHYSFGVALKIGIWSSVILLILAILDYLYQVYEFEKSIKMTKQELKDEYKTMEGDPLIKRALRERGRQIAMSRMMQRAKEADVLITNPTHYSVALYYDLGMNAPIVIAKGKGFIALKLREIAEENDTPIVHDPLLARALYHVELDDTIPAEYFRTVAEILAFISRQNERLKAKYSVAVPA
jgi:flagellar biosynthesis protein FlhB